MLLDFVRPTLKIFLFPLTRPCLTGMGRSVGKLFYFTSQIPYPLNLIVNSPTLGNNIKYTNNLQQRIFFKITLFTLDNSLSLQIANEFKKKYFLTEN